MNIYYHSVCAFIIRVIFVLYSDFQDHYSEVKYTDIDYYVFSDAANYAWNGESPFKRHTYRYSPILAYLLTPTIFIHRSFGKFLFCILDIVTSVLIYNIQRKYGKDTEISKKCAFLWLYNPLAIVISTRGSSESVMTSLIMLSILLYRNNQIFVFGLVYGFAVHMKIYPCIYAITFYFVLSDSFSRNITILTKLKTLFYPNKHKIVLTVSSLLGFAIPTVISTYLFGYEYINEALIYHVRRKDVRHNFSPYFYILYLSSSVSPELSSIISFSSFLLQMFLIVLTSWHFYLPQTLPLCLFIETFLFVTFNKVCTSQYFLWYLCLFPLCYPILTMHHKQLLAAFSLWLFGQILWLVAAYFLEFKGINTFFLIFVASLIFFLINIFIIQKFIHLGSKYMELCKENIKEE